jgi:hypothetical protein
MRMRWLVCALWVVGALGVDLPASLEQGAPTISSAQAKRRKHKRVRPKRRRHRRHRRRNR